MLVAEKMENGCGFHRTRWSAIGTIRMAAIIYAPRRRRRITRRILSIASRLVQELRRGGKSQRPNDTSLAVRQSRLATWRQRLPWIPLIPPLEAYDRYPRCENRAGRGDRPVRELGRLRQSHRLQHQLRIRSARPVQRTRRPCGCQQGAEVN